jgi:uncharacterized protein
MSISHSTSSALAVLDTNVILDWLVFDQPSCQPIIESMAKGCVQWIGTQAMRDELAHVLSRQLLAAWAPDETRIWRAWDRFCKMVAPPEPGFSQLLRCTDVDDQKFIDLALQQGQWLLSRDRAVLKLARRAAPWGVRIATPEKWFRDHERESYA